MFQSKRNCFPLIKGRIQKYDRFCCGVSSLLARKESHLAGCSEGILKPEQNQTATKSKLVAYGRGFSRWMMAISRQPAARSDQRPA
jgi:hypothetical protein